MMLYKISSQTDYLAGLKDKECYDFIELFLMNDITHFFIGNQEPYERFADIYIASDPRLKQKLKKIISSLLFNVDVNLKSFQILFSLIYLISRFRIINEKTNSRRISLLEKKRLIHKYRNKMDEMYGEDFHLILLRSIADQISPSIKDTLENIALFGVSKEGIRVNPKYFAICYRMLYGINKKYALDYINQFIDLGSLGYFNLATELHFLLEKHNKFIINGIYERYSAGTMTIESELALAIALRNIDRDDVFPQHTLDEANLSRSERDATSSSSSYEVKCTSNYDEIYHFLLDHLLGGKVTIKILNKDVLMPISEYIIRRIALLLSNLNAIKDEINIRSKCFKGLQYILTCNVPDKMLAKNASEDDLLSLIGKYIEKVNVSKISKCRDIAISKLIKAC